MILIIRVVSVPGALNSFPILACPVPQCPNRFQPTTAELGQFVFNTRGDSRIESSCNQTISLQTFQRSGEHALRYAVNPTANLPKTLLAVAQKQHNQHTPFVPNPIQDLAHSQAGN